MTPIVTYSVNCSLEAFQKAMEKHMPGAEFHEVLWCEMRSCDDLVVYSYVSFSWPAKEVGLTKELFFAMAVTALYCDEKEGEFYIEVSLEDDFGRRVVTVFDSWTPSFGKLARANPTLKYDKEAFSKDMAAKLEKIAAIACGG